MRIAIEMTLLVGSAALALASPIASPIPSPGPPKSPPPPPSMGGMVAGIGKCPKDCWNEAAARAGCDPNTNDACLCGPFFDAVTYCTAATCNASDNLAALNFLSPAC